MFPEDVRPYATHSPFTDPRRFIWMLDKPAMDAASVCSIVQGSLIHLFELHHYPVQVPPQEQRLHTDLEYAELLLERIAQRDDRPVAYARSLDRRLCVICRQYALLATCIMRHNGIAARVRGGFADYLGASVTVGHSVCEYWDMARGAWVKFDPQIDAVQRQAHRIDFDPLNVPPERHLSPASAWMAYRRGRLRPEDIEGGLANLRNGLFLDLFEMNMRETHRLRPPLMIDPSRAPTEAMLPALDALAEASLASQASFRQVAALFQTCPTLALS